MNPVPSGPTPFIGDDVRIATWQALFEKAMAVVGSKISLVVGVRR
jgi:hypothetical protein